MWQQKLCIKCGRYKAQGNMVKVTFSKASKITFGYICKKCFSEEEEKQCLSKNGS